MFSASLALQFQRSEGSTVQLILGGTFCLRRADAAIAPSTVVNRPEMLSGNALSGARVIALCITPSTSLYSVSGRPDEGGLRAGY
jgi:hypothetical protein